QDQRTRVHHALRAIVTGYRLQHRGAVDRDQDGRRIADDHLRGGVLPFGDGRFDACQRERSGQPVERDRADRLRELRLQLGRVGGAVVRQRRGGGLCDFFVFEDTGGGALFA